MLDVRGLQLLVKKRPTTTEEWVAYLDTRSEMMEGFLHYLPSRDLTDVPCVNDGHYVRTLDGLKDDARACGRRITIDYQEEGLTDKIPKLYGIFEPMLVTEGWMPHESCEVEEKLALWGLLRNRKWLGVWVSAGITFYPEWRACRDKPEPASFARTHSIVIWETSTEELIREVDPRTVADWLSRRYLDWFTRLEKRHAEARPLAEVIEAENELLRKGDVPA